MRGEQVGPERHFDRIVPARMIRLGLGSDWASGLYYAELTAPGDRVGYAPFVLAPRRLGAHRIAVVLPTLTWQAYNFRDDDHDGVGNTWYASPEIATARAPAPVREPWRAAALPDLRRALPALARPQPLCGRLPQRRAS